MIICAMPCLYVKHIVCGVPPNIDNANKNVNLGFMNNKCEMAAYEYQENYEQCETCVNYFKC